MTLLLNITTLSPFNDRYTRFSPYGNKRHKICIVFLNWCPLMVHELDIIILPSAIEDIVLLPEHCSAKVEGEECQLPPSYIISVKSHDGEYMLAVVCEDHKSAVEARLTVMQEANKIPQGTIHFQQVKAVVTDCVTGINEDYIELNGRVEGNR